MPDTDGRLTDSKRLELLEPLLIVLGRLQGLGDLLLCILRGLSLALAHLRNGLEWSDSLVTLSLSWAGCRPPSKASLPVPNIATHQLTLAHFERSSDGDVL